MVENDCCIYELLQTSAPPSSFELVHDSILTKKMIELWNLKEQKNSYSKLFADLYLQEIVIKLIQRKSINLLSNAGGKISEQSKIGKAITFIKRNYKDKITNDQLAKVVGMSRADFYTKFKQITGQTPNEFLNNERIQRSKILLGKSDKSVKEIGYEVGFITNHYFINRFKNKVGETPGIFKKQLRQIKLIN